MLKYILIASSLLFSFSSLAGTTVVCTNPEMGVLTIEGALNECRVTLEHPQRMPWFSTGTCVETFDGATYKMSAEMYYWGASEKGMIVITRGTSTDIQNVRWSDGYSAVMQFGRHELRCQ